MRKSIEEIFESFSSYVHAFEQLKKLHPKAITEIRDVFTPDELSKWPILSNSPKKLYPYLEQLTACLDDILTDADGFRKTQVLAALLINLDDEFKNPAFMDKMLTSVVGKKKDLFIKPGRFWKQHQQSPIEITKPFRTFGVFNPEHPVRIVRLDDLIDKNSIFNNKLDHLFRPESLNIGLFPLSLKYLRSFKITRRLYHKRKIYGFRTGQELHPDYKTELDHVLKLISRENLDIACFPELLISAEAQEYLAAGIQKMQKKFFILIAGSDHRVYEEDDYKNSIPVMIFMDGLVDEHSYSKQDLFNVNVGKGNLAHLKKFFDNFDDFFKSDANSYGVYLQEDAVPDTSLLLLTSKKYGDIGFVICKDFLPDASQIVQNYNRIADHIFIVSLNFSVRADFIAKSTHAVDEHNMAVFYVNARSFDQTFKSRTFYITPEKRKHKFIKKNQTGLVYPLPALDLENLQQPETNNVVEMSNWNKK